MSRKVSKEKGKLLLFPTSRSKTSNELVEETEKNLTRTRILAGISLAFVIVGTAVLNSSFEDNLNAGVKPGRTLASLSKTSEQRIKNLRWEHEIAERVSRVAAGRDIASIGRKPNLKEMLQFGYLEGKYAISYERNKIKKINFNDSSGIGTPNYVVNRQAFIGKYKSLLPVSFSDVRLKENLVVGNKIQEVYELRNNGEKVIAEVEFNMDTEGRFLSMVIK